MYPFIKLDMSLFLLFKKKIACSEVLCYDSDFNPLIVTYDTIIENKIPIYIRCPPFLIESININSENCISNEATLSIELRSQQINLINKVLDMYEYSYNKPMYLCLQCPCGFGKTIVTIGIITKLKLKCAIIVPLRFIADQWLNKFKSFCSDSKVYCSTGGIQDAIRNMDSIKQCDIFICPDKHLQNKVIHEFITQNFNFIVIDEIHRYNLNNDTLLTRFLYSNYFKVCLLLSATPSRNMHLVCDTIINKREDVKNSTNILVIVESINNIIQSVVPQEIKKCLYNISKDKYKVEYIKNYYYKYCISQDINRNNYINTIIKQCNYSDTRALILTDYRQHMQVLYNLIKVDISDVYMYDVKNKKSISLVNDIIHTKSTYIIISTISACSQGLDIPLNTLHIALPITNITTLIQSIGRIFRSNDLEEIKFIYYYNFSFIHNIIKTFINDKARLIQNHIINSNLSWKINKIYI